MQRYEVIPHSVSGEGMCGAIASFPPSPASFPSPPSMESIKSPQTPALPISHALPYVPNPAELYRLRLPFPYRHSALRRPASAANAANFSHGPATWRLAPATAALNGGRRPKYSPSNEKAARQQGSLFFRENSSNGGKAIGTFWSHTKFEQNGCQGQNLISATHCNHDGYCLLTIRLHSYFIRSQTTPSDSKRIGILRLASALH